MTLLKFRKVLNNYIKGKRKVNMELNAAGGRHREERSFVYRHRAAEDLLGLESCQVYFFTIKEYLGGLGTSWEMPGKFR